MSKKISNKRKYPKVLFAVGGKGKWCYEGDGGPRALRNLISTGKTSYLSDAQIYKRWHFAIQWPLIVSFHFYFRGLLVGYLTATSTYLGRKFK